MTWLRVTTARVRGVFTRRHRERDLSEEIESHLAFLAQEHVARGLPPAAARAAARRDFGGLDPIKEEVRDLWGLPWLESLLQDARYGVRQLKRYPVMSAAAIATLALAIGATTAIFSLLDTVVLKALPYSDAGRLVVIHEATPRAGTMPVSPADATVWQAESTSFDQIALLTATIFNVSGSGQPERITAGLATSNLFETLAVRPQVGRLFRQEESTPGQNLVVALTDGLWRRKFAADPAIAGQALSMNGRSYTIIGVLPASFRPPSIKQLYAMTTDELRPDLWVPLAFNEDDRRPTGNYSFACIARLRPGVSVASAGAELQTVQDRRNAAVPGKGEVGTVVVPMRDQIGSRSRPGLQVMSLAVAAVLLITCANLTGLLLARAAGRRREMATRLSLGAGRLRVARQLLVENVLLCVAGAAGGLAVAYVIVRVIVAATPGDLPRLDEVQLDGRALGFTAAITALVALVVALLPAWRTSDVDMREAASSRTAAGAAGVTTTRLRSMLVAGQIGMSVVCLVLAGLLFQSFTRLLQVEKGFDHRQLLTIELNLATAAYPDAQRRSSFVDRLLERLETMPGVIAVAAMNRLPITGQGASSAISEVGTVVPPPERPVADVRSVSPGYLKTLGIPLQAGRWLAPADVEARVAVVSSDLANRAWPGEDPLGRRFRFGTNAGNQEVYEVVGVIGAVRSHALDQPTNNAYVPFPQRTGASVAFAVKVAGDAVALAGQSRRLIQSLDPQLPVGEIRTMDEVIAGSLSPRRFQLQLLVIFALTAIVLASIGVYGVVSHSVAQRRHEIGIRMALGASPAGVAGGVIRQGLLPVALGLLVAVPLSVAVASGLQAMLFGIAPHDPITLLAAALIVFITAAAAVSWPAHRATRVGPMAALRYE